MKKIAILILSIIICAIAFSFKPVGEPEKYVYPEGKLMNINGYKLWVETEGKGDAIIFIPGGPGSSHAYFHTFHYLKDSFQLVYVDFLGRGKSDTAKTRKEYAVANEVEQVEGIRKALKLDKITVLGHSYGSLVAQAYAIKYPQYTKRMIIANGFHSGWMWQENCDNSNRCVKSGYPEIWEKLMKHRSQGGVSADSTSQALYGEVPYGFLYCFNPTIKNAYMKEHKQTFSPTVYFQMVGRDGDFIIGGDIADFDVRTKLKDLKMPILVMAGRYDRVSTPEMAILYKQYCPQAEYVMFEKSGHNPYIEEPEKAEKVLRAFLKK